MNKAKTEEKGEQERNSYITYIYNWFLFLYIFRTWINKWFSKMFGLATLCLLIPPIFEKISLDSQLNREWLKYNSFWDITIDAKGLQYLGHHGLWAGRGFYRAAYALARSLVIFDAIRRDAQYFTTPTHKGNLLWLRKI